MKQFEVTDDHIKLLRRAYVGWDDCEFGAPAIDCKRPYGNSSVHSDIAEILDITPAASDGDEFSQEQYDQMERLHKETQTVLQIVLSTGTMKAGTYVKSDNYGTDWRPLSLQEEEGHTKQ
jgi:hypothetical protein